MHLSQHSDNSDSPFDNGLRQGRVQRQGCRHPELGQPNRRDVRHDGPIWHQQESQRHLRESLFVLSHHSLLFGPCHLVYSARSYS